VGVIQQALLGYDHGHRLLVSSAELPRDEEATLVALSDVSVTHGRRLAGLPLPSSKRYALMATWPAPDAGRPGAVWAHVLLLDPGVFEECAVSDLVTMLSPPSSREPRSHYAEPLAAPGRTKRPARARPHDCYLCARAIYASKSGQTFLSDQESAEAAVVALWSAQWPALQARFSFALRSAAHRTRHSADLVVLTGRDAPSLPPHGDDPWLRALADELAGAEGDLTSWLAAFGPAEPARIASVRALARLWSNVQNEQVPELLGALAERYPTPKGQASMKLAVFGAATNWWGVPERQRLAALLASPAHAWDLTQLEFEARLERECLAGHWEALIEALAPDTPANARDALLGALASAPAPAMLAALAARDVALACDLLAQSRIGSDPHTWRGVPGETVTELLLSSHAGVRPKELAAALRAGHISAVISAAGVHATLKAASHVDAKTLTGIAKSAEAQELLRGADPAETLALAAAGAKVPAAQRASALEALRANPDARWLRLAVTTLLDDPKSLEVVFGPLHAAAVDGRLTQANAKRLEKALPPGNGVPRRLRALLLTRARKEHWTRPRLARTMRGAGPDARLLLAELEPKDPLQKAVKWLLSKARVRL
jgi:GTPase-associated protein 1, N-terminal domain type 1